MRVRDGFAQVALSSLWRRRPWVIYVIHTAGNPSRVVRVGVGHPYCPSSAGLIIVFSPLGIRSNKAWLPSPVNRGDDR